MKLFSEKNGESTHNNKNATRVQSGGAEAPTPKSGGSAFMKKAPDSNNSNKKIIIIVSSIVAFICATLLLLGAYANGVEGFYPNVSMEGVDLSGLNLEEAANALAGSGFGDAKDKELVVSLPADCELKISAVEAGCFLDAADAANYAYDECHGKGFFGNTITFVKCVFGGLDLKIADITTLNEEYIRKQTNDASKKVSLALMESEVKIGEDSITVIKGASSLILDEEKLFEIVKTALSEGRFEPFKYEAGTSGTVDGDLDLQKLYDNVFGEPENAVYDTATKTATEHKEGRSFDMAEAQRLWDQAQSGDNVVIPIIKTMPEVTTEILNNLLFSDVLAQKSTTLSGSSAARINNIVKSAAAINGMVMNPGDEFSFNAVVGQRTSAAGYLGAGAYSGGKVVTEVGGGICQVSSTLYYCALLSNLEITARSCHYFGVSYLPAGLDATVSWPAPEFKFKNNSPYPIKISASVDKAKNTVGIQIVGSNPEGIRVEMSVDSWKIEGGYSTQSYRSVFDKNGNLISKTKEASSTYHYEVKETPSPKPSPVPSPSSPPVTDNPSVPPTTPVTPPPTVPVTPPIITEPPVVTPPPIITPPPVEPPVVGA